MPLVQPCALLSAQESLGARLSISYSFRAFKSWARCVENSAHVRFQDRRAWHAVAKFGTVQGDWRGISRHYVLSRSPTQVASHAQKYYIRQSAAGKRKRRSSLFDLVPERYAVSLCTDCVSPTLPRVTPHLSVYRALQTEAGHGLRPPKTASVESSAAEKPKGGMQQASKQSFPGIMPGKPLQHFDSLWCTRTHSSEPLLQLVGSVESHRRTAPVRAEREWASLHPFVQAPRELQWPSGIR